MSGCARAVIPVQSSFWTDRPASPAIQEWRRRSATKIVKGGALEPTPVKGKNGTVDLKFQAAYDAKNAYLRFQWKTLNAYPGSEHQYLRFDGKEWKVYCYPKLDKVVQEGKQPGIYEDRMTIMIDDGKVAVRFLVTLLYL